MFKLKIIKLSACLIISCICLFIVFRKVNMNEVFMVLANVNYVWLGLATLFGVSKMWIAGFRWHYLISVKNRISTQNSFYFYAIGTMVNMTLPFRIGDLLRARLIAEKLNISNSMVLGAIAREHILDLITLFSLLFICIFIYSYHWPTQVLFSVKIFSYIIFTIGAVIFVLKQINRLFNFKNLIKNRFNKYFLYISKTIMNFYFGFFQLGNFYNILKMCMVTLLIWFAQGCWIYFLFNALGLVQNYHLGVEAICVLMVMMGIAVMIPASPGYIGTFHLMILLGLTQLGVPKSISLSYAILAHAHTIIFAILLGLYSLWRGKIKLPLLLKYRTA